MAESKKPSGKGKVKVELINDPSSACPVHNWAYILGAIILAVYSIYLYDKNAFHSYAEKYSFIEPVEKAFILIEKYSPFQEFLDDDDGHQLKRENQERKSEKDHFRIMTKEELKTYDGSPDSPGLYLAMMGQIFDVSKGKDHYGPNGGYSFFSAKDGTRAFVTGEFNEAGLIEDISGLSNGDYIGLKEWIGFYHKDYKYIGKLVGLYFDKMGNPTEYSRKVESWIFEAEEEADKKNVVKKMFPPCNSEWSQATNSLRVWCTKKSGGQDRDWIGVPRKLFYPGQKERCACVKNSGPPSTDPASDSNFGDLKNPHVKEYEDCDPTSSSCKIVEKS